MMRGSPDVLGQYDQVQHRDTDCPELKGKVSGEDVRQSSK